MDVILQFMQKKPNFKIVIQASALGWDGSSDMCLNKIDGHPIVYWVIKKALKSWPGNAIIIAAPTRDKNSLLHKYVSSVNNKNVSIVWGSNNDVLSRLVKATVGLMDQDYFLRILGVHYFFSPNIANKLLKHAFSDKCDWVKPPDDYEIQLTSEVIRVGALKNLNNYLKTKKLSSAKTIRTSPIHYLVNVSNKDSGHVIEKLPLPGSQAKRVIRKKAKKIYTIDRTEVNIHKAISSGAQLIFHYEIAKNKIDKNALVLDIACGNGFGTKMLANKAYFVVGADIDDKVLSYAQKHNNARNIMYIKADAAEMPFAEHSFDAVVSMETLEHVEDKIFLKEIKRVLKPGGTLILSTPQNRHGNIPINPFHKHEYSLKELNVLITRYLKIQKMIGIKTGRLVIENNPLGSNTIVIARKSK